MTKSRKNQSPAHSPTWIPEMLAHLKSSCIKYFEVNLCILTMMMAIPSSGHLFPAEAWRIYFPICFMAREDRGLSPGVEEIAIYYQLEVFKALSTQNFNNWKITLTLFNLACNCSAPWALCLSPLFVSKDSDIIGASQQ